VLGAGSAGARHARNLLALGARVAVADPDDARAHAVPGVDVVAPGLDRLEGYDGIVVATPTALHRAHALAALDSGARVFVEKPLAASVAGLDELVRAGSGRLTVGYNLRFHPPVERFRELIASGRAGTPAVVHAWFGSWLPDWRPGSEYRTGYSARSELGGGILNDASHELDLLVWLFGTEWDVQGAVLATRSRLEIDVEDVAVALLRSADGLPAVVTLDAVSRRYRRGLEVVGDDATVRLDWARRVIEIEDAAGVTVEEATESIDVSYRREAEAFLAFVRGTAGAAVPVEEAAVSVRLCARIREQAEPRR
jgi:predicted dehydrogenase